MSRTIQPTSQTEVEAEEFIWPEFNPSHRYREFIERLRLARLERGLSIADMSDEVGLTFRLAHEFENIVAPLPFEWLEVWCETVGVPFADYLTIYRADEREWDARQDELEIETDQQHHEPLALPNVNRAFRWLSILCSVAAHIVKRFLSRYSTPN